MSLLFDFVVDKAKATIHVTREFAADADLVWDAWTKAEILDQWTAPRPWRAQTKEMNFQVGGRWLYAMISPENLFHWSLAEFIEINPKTSFLTKNSFSDENGNPVNSAFSITRTSFKAAKGKTTVYVEKKFNDLADIEMMVARGFKEGMNAGLNNLDDYLTAITSAS